jgi:hypothetical protein
MQYITTIYKTARRLFPPCYGESRFSLTARAWLQNAAVVGWQYKRKQSYLNGSVAAKKN